MSHSHAKRVAVIVPVLNEADILPVLLKKLPQYGADEIIVVDGGSGDDSMCLLRNFAGHCLQSKPGRSVQMNAGAAASSADILLFIHADTDFSSCYIEDVKVAMREPAVVGGRFDVRLSGAHPAFRVIEIMMSLRSRLTKISTGDQAIFVRREVFDKIGGFPNQPLMEDIEFSKLLKKQGNIACLRRKIVTSSRRWEKYGILRTVLLMWRLRLLYWFGVPASRLATMYREAR